jgi:phage terminase small subunit
MPLHNPRYEQFAQGLAEGKPAYQAYIDAGFAKVGAAQSASRLLKSQRAGIRDRIAFANLMDYMRIGPSGDPVLDFSDLTREQAAALTEITVDDYLDGRGERARDVRKVKFKLGDKRAALMDIAKLFGWITERRENKIVDEFDTMSDEQIEAWLDERAEARVKMRRLDAATSGQNGRSRRASARSVSSTTASAMAELLE